jgi:hypothetical protein
VLDQGALRFDVPEDWVMEPGEKSVKFFDRQPPEDECCLQVSFFRHPQVDWSRFSLDQALYDLLGSNFGEKVSYEDIRREQRPGIEVAWAERKHIDPHLQRPARSRVALIRGLHGHALITLDFWEADAGRLLPVWNDVMGSIDMGLKVQDPTVGELRM